VTGSRKLPYLIKGPFKEGLMKIATSANSTLIITDGTMKSIGQAIAEYNMNNKKVFLLGINNWGKVDERDKLEVLKNFQNEHLLKKNFKIKSLRLTILRKVLLW
jgi:hypothetical protein